MKLIAWKWRTGKDCVGIVLTKDSAGKDKAYIGVGFGHDEDTDVRNIAELGCRLRFSEAKAFFPHIEEKDYYTEG